MRSVDRFRGRRCRKSGPKRRSARRVLLRCDRSRRQSASSQCQSEAADYGGWRSDFAPPPAAIGTIGSAADELRIELQRQDEERRVPAPVRPVTSGADPETERRLQAVVPGAFVRASAAYLI